MSAVLAHVRRNIVGYVALFVALGGSSYAAIRATHSSSPVVHACYKTQGGALRVVGPHRHCGRGEKAISWNQQGPSGLAGRNGQNGQPGAPGTALAYAHVLADGTVDAASSKNVTSANVTQTSPHSGVYCFNGLRFTPHNAVASAGFSANADTVIVELAGTPDFGLTGCPAGTQMIAITFKHQVPPGNEDADFYIQIN